MKDFAVSKEINYICIALSQNRFVLSNSSITMNLSKYKKILCFYVRVKKHYIAAFMKINSSWILVSLLTLLYLSLTLLI